MAHATAAAPLAMTSSPAPVSNVDTPDDAGYSPPPQAHAQRPRNRIQVSREKRPLYFFIGLAKKFLTSEEEVELSGLGLAVTTVVTVAEILKNSGHVTISRIRTSLVEMPVEQRGGNANNNSTANTGANSDVRATTPKAKIQIWIKKSDQFEELTQYVDHAKKGTRKNGKHKHSNVQSPTAAPANVNPDINGNGNANTFNTATSAE